MAKGKYGSGGMMALLATLALSTTAPVGRYAMQGGMNPTALLVARYLLAWLLMGVVLRFSTRSENHLDTRGLWFCVAAGLASGAATLAYFWSIRQINASIAAMLVSLYPLVVLLLLTLRGERFTSRSGLRLALGLCGVYMLVGPGGKVSATGMLLSLISAISFAVQLVITQWFLPTYSVRAVTYYIIAVSAIVVTGFWLFQGAEWGTSGWQEWLAIGVLAIVSTFLSRLAMFRAVQEIGSGQLALLAPLETFLAVLWSVLFLHEHLTFLEWAGGALILFSALLAVKPLRGFAANRLVQ